MRLFKRKGSPYWQIAYKDHRNEWVEKSTNRSDKQAAREWGLQQERESLRDPLEQKRAAATLRDALDLLEEHLLESVEAGSMADQTAKFYVKKAKELLRVWGPERLLSTIDTGAVRRYVTARRKPRVMARGQGSRTVAPASNHTLIKELTTLRIALRLAKERGLWTGDLETLQPADLSSDYTPRERVVTPAEVDLLRAELPAHRWRVVAFSLATGAELSAWWRALRADVDLVNGYVLVRGTKRAARWREVPLVLPLCRELAREALQGGDYAGTTEHPLDPPHLFAPWPSMRNELLAACARAGITPVTPNDLRRSYATWHVEAGVSLDVLFRPMGHVDTRMLARTYAKPKREVMADQMRAQVDAKKKPKGDPEK